MDTDTCDVCTVKNTWWKDTPRAKWIVMRQNIIDFFTRAKYVEVDEIRR